MAYRSPESLSYSLADRWLHCRRPVDLPAQHFASRRSHASSPYQRCWSTRQTPSSKSPESSILTDGWNWYELISYSQILRFWAEWAVVPCLFLFYEKGSKTHFVPTHHDLRLVLARQMVMHRMDSSDCPYEISYLRISGLSSQSFRLRNHFEPTMQ